MVIVSVMSPVFSVTPSAWRRSQNTTPSGVANSLSTYTHALTVARALDEFLLPPPFVLTLLNVQSEHSIDRPSSRLPLLDVLIAAGRLKSSNWLKKALTDTPVGL